METWTGNSLARTEQNRIFAIIICIKYPLSADISQGSDVYKCQVNDTFIIIDAVCLLYTGAVQLLSFPSQIRIRMNVRDVRKVKGPASRPAASPGHDITDSLSRYFLLPTSVCCLSLSSWNFMISFIFIQTSCQNTKFCHTFCWFRTERTVR